MLALPEYLGYLPLRHIWEPDSEVLHSFVDVNDGRKVSECEHSDRNCWKWLATTKQFQVEMTN